ncbi:hypothetical protein GEMRC1_012948 [Eukaryota sp. GEM-RC1]
MATVLTRKVKVQKREHHVFHIDCSSPADDSILDPVAFETYLQDRIKVEGKTKNLGENVAIRREGNIITIETQIPFSKRYLKYLAKRFLKNTGVRDFLRVIANKKDSYVLKYFQTAEEDQE